MSNFFEKGKITLMEFLTIILFCFGALVHILTTSVAMDTIAANQTIRDGDTIVSADENFELGFFSPGNSKNRYLGIWYKKISNGTVVWVANREAPAVNTSGLFKVNSEGVVVLYSGTNTVIWSSNFSSSMRTINPVAKLLDNGNLVIRDESSSDLENFIWQSFDYPGDTFLPGMKLGKDLVTGIERNLTSWKTLDDPSSGMYTIWMDINGYPQIFETKEGSGFDSRLGSWNGLRFSGQPTLRPNPIYTFGFVSNEMEVYYKYELMNSSVRSRMQLRPDGAFQQLIWIDRTQEWVVYLFTVTDICDRYGLCGVYGRCNIDNSPACGCLNGFEPKLLEEWSTGDYSSGCRQSIPLALDCGNGDGFQKFSSLKLPDTRHSWFNFSMTLGECEIECQKNCSCTAYANLDIRQGGSGCLLWFGDLTDIREYPDTGQDLYIRMAYSELLVSMKGHKKKGVIKVTLSTIFGVVLLGLTLTVYAWRKKKRPHLKSEAFVKDYTNKSQKEDLELPLFSLSKIVKATNNFSINNKLGEGGFGPVYKGVLEGQEIAVKRLSKTSRQGLDEFKNEVICVAKLQHRNLVKLLGFCIKGDEMMLIYEYMPNKSLDSFIFDETKNLLLDWPQRFHIIHGIARGLLYLHQDSRLRIIHRDLKASNILLDFKMNPKISDFGLARMFREYETEANTNKVVGTLGYISPEYAVNGLFSVKSDIFSFGVLVLEIVSGKKNRGFSHQDHHDNLLGHAWRLNKEGKSLELADVSLGNSWTVSEVLRSIHVGLLCVQQHAEDRPDMSDVVLMLGGEGVLHLPKQPGFFTEVDSTTIMPPASVSVNEVTLTLLDAR